MLDLSFNKIQYLKETYFTGMPELSILDLSFNQIESIEEFTFSDLMQLKSVYLNNNRIKEFYFSDFNNFNYVQTSLEFPNLKELKLNNNNLELKQYLNSKLVHLQNLKTIDFSFNSIQSDEFSSSLLFRNVKNELLNLNLSFNKLSILSAKYFKYMIKLKILDLSFNKIFKLEQDVFKVNLNLEVLDLKENGLKNLHVDCFKGLFRLEYLNLSGNFLVYLEENLFSDLKSLIDLDLSNNRLKNIGPNTFISMEYLLNLNLAQNCRLIFEQNSLKGLNLLKNLKFSFSVFLNKTNLYSISSSLRPNIYKNVNEMVYYESINIQFYFDRFQNAIFCSSVVYFSKYNILLNLKTQEQFKNFIRLCSEELLTKNEK